MKLKNLKASGPEKALPMLTVWIGLDAEGLGFNSDVRYERG